MIKKFFSRKIEYYIWNLDFSNLFEVFLVAAVSSLLGVRAYLEITGYPMVGGGNFHIAHMLWGGLLMAVAILMLLGFLNKHVKPTAAVVGGAGFGIFIDELGKFITKDNNYFFEPTVALLYVIFMLMYFAIKLSERYSIQEPSGYAVNAVESLKELLIKDLDEAEKQHALRLLEKADTKNPIVIKLIEVIQAIEANPTPNPNFLTKSRAYLRDGYTKLIKNPLFAHILIAFFSVYALVNLMNAVRTLPETLRFADWGELVSSVIAALFIVRGIRFVKKSQRLRAYQQFRYSLLVSIFFTQFFLFIKEQFSALIALAISWAVYSACHYLISQEQDMLHQQKMDPEKILQKDTLQPMPKP